MTGLWLVSYVALWLLFLVVAVVLLGTLRNLGALYESVRAQSTSLSKRSNLVNGQRLPAVELHNLDGVPVPISAFVGEKTGIVIVSPSCLPCHALLSDLSNAAIDLDPLDPTVQRAVVISLADTARTVDLAREVGLPSSIPMLADEQGMVTREWGISTTPTTIITNEHGNVVRQVFGVSEPSHASSEAHSISSSTPQYVSQDQIKLRGV